MLGNADQAIVAWNEVLLEESAQRAGPARAGSSVPARGRDPRARRQPAAAARAGHADDPAETVGLLGAPGRTARAEPRRSRRAVETYRRCSRSSRRTPRRSSRLERILPTPSRSWRSRSCWSRSTGSGATTRARSPCTRSRRAMPSTPKQIYRPLRRSIAQGYELGLDDPDGRTRRSGAPWARIRSTRRCSERRAAWPARSASSRTWSGATASCGVGGLTILVRKMRALSQDRQPAEHRSLGDRSAAAGLRAALEVSAS